jgi:hypothetical protein
MAAMTEITCKCGCQRKKMVRTADVKRGWGLYYSKSCKAKRQARTGGSNLYFKTKRYQEEYGGYPEFDKHGEFIGVSIPMEDMGEGNVQ